MRIRTVFHRGVAASLLGLAGTIVVSGAGCSPTGTPSSGAGAGGGAAGDAPMGDPVPPSMTMTPPPGSGAGNVDSPPLPGLRDSAAVYDPNDLGPVEIQIDVPDAQTLSAIEAQAAGGPTKTAAVVHAPEFTAGAA